MRANPSGINRDILGATKIGQPIMSEKAIDISRDSQSLGYQPLSSEDLGQIVTMSNNSITSYKRPRTNSPFPQMRVNSLQIQQIN